MIDVCQKHQLTKIFPLNLGKIIIEYSQPSHRMDELNELSQQGCLYFDDGTPLEDWYKPNDGNAIFLLVDTKTNSICGMVVLDFVSLENLKQYAIDHPDEVLPNSAMHWLVSENLNNVINIGYHIVPSYRNQGLLQYLKPLFERLGNILTNNMWYCFMDKLSPQYDIQLKAFQSINRFLQMEPIEDEQSYRNVYPYDIVVAETIKDCLDRPSQEFDIYYSRLRQFNQQQKIIIN